MPLRSERRCTRWPTQSNLIDPAPAHCSRRGSQAAVPACAVRHGRNTIRAGDESAPFRSDEGQKEGSMTATWTISVRAYGKTLYGIQALDTRRKLGLSDGTILSTEYASPAQSAEISEDLARRWLKPNQTHDDAQIDYEYLLPTDLDTRNDDTTIVLRDGLPAARIIEIWVAHRERMEQQCQAAERAAADQLAQQARRAVEKADWITEHGSDRLKRLLSEGIECESVYLDERIAAERPGWSYQCDRRGEAEEVRNARQEGLDLLDEARKTDPQAKLAWWTIDHEHDGCEDAEDCPRYDWKGYACTSIFLGSDIVYGVPEEYAC